MENQADPDLCVNTLSNASAFISEYVKYNRYYSVNLYILNTGFNIGDRIASFKYIYDSPWITFNDQIGT